MVVSSRVARNPNPPDYDLADRIALTRTDQVKAIGHPLRTTILGLLHERAEGGEEMPRDFNDFEVAAGESADAFRDGKLWGFIRHARITEDQASEFWERMAELVAEFDRLPRSGDTMYGFAIGVYPTDQPTLPSGDA